MAVSFTISMPPKVLFVLYESSKWLHLIWSVTKERSIEWLYLVAWALQVRYAMCIPKLACSILLYSALEARLCYTTHICTVYAKAVKTCETSSFGNGLWRITGLSPPLLFQIFPLWERIWRSLIYRTLTVRGNVATQTPTGLRGWQISF